MFRKLVVIYLILRVGFGTPDTELISPSISFFWKDNQLALGNDNKWT